MNPSDPISPPEPQPKLRKLLSRLVDVALWVGVVAALYLAFGRRDRGPVVGSQAATFELPVVGESRTITIAGKRDRPLLVKAFASWCGACKRANWYDDPTGARTAGTLDVVAVSLDDSADTALQAKNEWSIPFDVAHDPSGRFAQAYQVSILPTYILLGTEGRVLRVTSGMPSPLDLKAWADASVPASTATPSPE